MSLFRCRILWNASKRSAVAIPKASAPSSSRLFSTDTRSLPAPSSPSKPPLFESPALTTTGARVRLSKLLSSSLLTSSKSRSVAPRSRREAERLIRGGGVSIAGRVVTEPHYLVSLMDFSRQQQPEQGAEPPQQSKPFIVKVQGKSLSVTESDFKALLSSDDECASATTGLGTSAATQAAIPRVWIAHKLRGELVTERDPHDRPSLLDRLMRSGVGKSRKGGRVHLKPVGRLDMATEGLILLTSDGRYAREMELPMNQVRRTYRVRVHGPTDLDRLKRAAGRGVTVDGIRYAPMLVRVDPSTRFGSANRWLEITCCQGKNRQIRKVLSHFGLNVTRLIRVSYGDYKLDTIPPGVAVEVPYKPVDAQRRKGPLDLKPTTSARRLPRGGGGRQ